MIQALVWLICGGNGREQRNLRTGACIDGMEKNKADLRRTASCHARKRVPSVLFRSVSTSQRSWSCTQTSRAGSFWQGGEGGPRGWSGWLVALRVRGRWERRWPGHLLEQPRRLGAPGVLQEEHREALREGEQGHGLKVTSSRRRDGPAGQNGLAGRRGARHHHEPGPAYAQEYIDANLFAELDEYSSEYKWDDKLLGWALDLGVRGQA